MRPFSLHFSGTAWAQIGALESSQFEVLQNTLEHFARLAAHRLASGEPPLVDDCVPITAGGVIAECRFDDFRRVITVSQLVRWDSGQIAA